MTHVQGKPVDPGSLVPQSTPVRSPHVGVPAAAVTAADASSTAADQLQLVNQELETLTAVLAAHQQQQPSHAADHQDLVSGGNIAFEVLMRGNVWHCLGC